MFLDTVVYKGTRFNKKVILDVKTTAETTEAFQHTFWPLVTHRFVKRVWGKCFKFQKNAWWLMMNRGYHHNLKDKLQSEINETHRNRSPRSWNKTEQGRKRNVAFRPAFVTQYQPLVSTVKWKSGISYKTNLYFANFLKNHPLFPTRKENHGKEYAC